MNEHPPQPPSPYDGAQAPPAATEWPSLGSWDPEPADGTAPPPSFAAPGQPYGAAPYAAFPAPGRPVPGSGGTSGFAIASLVFGLFGGVLLSTIFGFVALHQVRKHGRSGRGLAVAGLALSAGWVLAIAAAVVFGVLSDSAGDTAGGTGTGAADGSVSVEKIKAGDCINGLRGTGTIEDLPVVSCVLPHEGEVFAVFSLPAGAWPGDAAVRKQAEKGCDDRFKRYVKRPDDTVEVLYLHPLRASWAQDRGVTCVATDSDGTRTGSVRD